MKLYVICEVEWNKMESALQGGTLRCRIPKPQSCGNQSKAAFIKVLSLRYLRCASESHVTLMAEHGLRLDISAPFAPESLSQRLLRLSQIAEAEAFEVDVWFVCKRGEIY